MEVHRLNLKKCKEKREIYLTKVRDLDNERLDIANEESTIQDDIVHEILDLPLKSHFTLAGLGPNVLRITTNENQCSYMLSKDAGNISVKKIKGGHSFTLSSELKEKFQNSWDEIMREFFQQK